MHRDVLAGIVAIIGLAVLMFIHESGHYLAARAFGMRVLKFSLGLGPAIWKYKPKGSDTTFQLAPIPFFAYVQIDGMNPLEEIDPKDKGSYANASLIGRMVTIFAGPFANYIFASIFFLIATIMVGTASLTTKVEVIPDKPAAQGGMLTGDKMLEVEGVPVKDWNHFRTLISARPEKVTKIVVDRKGQKVSLNITPAKEPKSGQGRIGASSEIVHGPVPLSTAIKQAALQPPLVVWELVVTLKKVIQRKQGAELGGPVAIVKEGKRLAEMGPGFYLKFLAFLSANLAGFNLLPIPALDGGRLLFLGYEGLSRRRPNAVVEAHIHFVGFIMLFALVLVVTFGDVFGKH
jgi:regulator of sigma E protease